MQKNCIPSGFGKKIAPPQAFMAKKLHPFGLQVYQKLLYDVQPGRECKIIVP